jgi:CRP/FNR family transcriptional regulator, dissimilatory nitrate respiration regulator
LIWIKPGEDFSIFAQRRRSVSDHGGPAMSVFWGKSGSTAVGSLALSLNVIDILQDCKMFSQVPPESFQRLVTIARLQQFRKGQVIFREAQPCPGMYVVGRGMVRVFKTAPGGKEHVLHMVGPGNTFAEVAAIGNFDLPANAEAVAKTTCLLLPQDRFRQILETDHPFCLGMMSGLAMWVRHLVTLMGDVVLRDAAGRLARFLLEAEPLPDGTIELPGLKRHIASHLNLTSETFSRMFRRLIDAGLIGQLDSTHIELLDRRKLRQLAEGRFPTV